MNKNLPIAFLLTLCVCLTAYNAKINTDRVNLPSPQKIDYSDQLDRIEQSIAKIAEGYAEKLDETTRQNVRLLQEVADQYNQIKLLEGVTK